MTVLGKEGVVEHAKNIGGVPQDDMAILILAYKEQPND
jgi:hypothetical protein